MATGLAIMGFGGGAMIGAPLADRLMNAFAGPATVGVWQTFAVMGAIYLASMMLGAFGYRLPPPGWQTGGVHAGRGRWPADDFTPRPRERGDPHAAVLAAVGRAVPQRERRHRRDRHGLADAAGGLRRKADRSACAACGARRRRSHSVATIAAAFAGLLSLFNIAGRIFWASLSDRIGRKVTYTVFFLLGIALYVSAPLAGETDGLPFSSQSSA
jgi:hypothetical protein